MQDEIVIVILFWCTETGTKCIAEKYWFACKLELKMKSSIAQPHFNFPIFWGEVRGRLITVSGQDVVILGLASGVCWATWSDPRCAAGSDREDSSLCSVGSAPGLSPPGGVCQLSGRRSLSAACHAASPPPPESGPADSESGGAHPPHGSTWVHMRVRLLGPLTSLSCLAVAAKPPAYRSESTAPFYLSCSHKLFYPVKKKQKLKLCILTSDLIGSIS